MSLVPYLCPAGYWTIGYGHRCERDHPAITRDTAEALLDSDLYLAQRQMYKVCPAIKGESAGRQAAILDFIFNLGAGRLRASTLRARIQAGDWDDVPTQLRRWVYGGGRKLKGLVLRREAEIQCLTS